MSEKMGRNISPWWIVMVIPAFAIGWMGGQLHAHPITITYPDSYKAGYDRGISDANEGLLGLIPLIIVAGYLLGSTALLFATIRVLHSWRTGKRTT